MAQDDYAIVVGIKTYPGLSPLKGPCKDAEAIYDWLIKPDCGAVPPDHIDLLKTTDFHPPGPNGIDDVHPLESEINKLFRPFVTKGVHREVAGRRLYIYMAGHGFGDPEEMNSAALYAADAIPEYAPHVAATLFAEWFRRNGVFEEIVLIMDCCRTAIPLWKIRPPPLPNTSNPGAAAKVRTVYAYATGWARVSRERPIDGDVRGIFTVTLLKALQNATPNRYGRVTGQVIKNYVHNTIKQVAGDVEIDPPEINVDSDRDIIFIERKSAGVVTVQVKLQPYAGGEVLIVQDGYRNEISRQISRAAVVEVELAPGLYKAFIDGSERLHLFEVGSDNVEFTL